MSQQLGIILMVDVNSATRENTLEGNTYLFDNMKLQGSEGQGTGALVSAINGSYWSDGSQANEQVLNWLPYGVGSLPPTIPKSFLTDKSKNSDLKILEDLDKLVTKLDKAKPEDIAAELKKMVANMGAKTSVKSRKGRSRRKKNKRSAEQKVMDVTGALVSMATNEIPEINSLNPIITDITGEAVDKNIIYPAAYGSPDMVTDGWYWAASVDTSRPGTYAYTMDVQLFKLELEDKSWTWVPVTMQCDAYLKITSGPKVNGFTGAGMGMLPIQ